MQFVKYELICTKSSLNRLKHLSHCTDHFLWHYFMCYSNSCKSVCCQHELVLIQILVTSVHYLVYKMGLDDMAKIYVSIVCQSVYVSYVSIFLNFGRHHIIPVSIWIILKPQWNCQEYPERMTVPTNLWKMKLPNS